MDAGQLKNRVLIQYPGTVRDSIGQPIPGWTDLRHTRAAIKHLSGMATIRAGAEAATNRVSMRLRHCTDIEPGMRVVQGAAVYSIKAVLPDAANRDYVDLVCEAIQ